ncbi:MAG: rab-GTPase-TBC domain-containing protein [Podila humilis]|nr:MAG: rab-GTPase-TBC domain-containing protein [Podila humilis]
MSRHVPPILRPPDPYLMTTTSTSEPERREALSSPSSSPSPPSQPTKSSPAFLSPPATPTTPTPQTHSTAEESLLLVTRDDIEGQDREGLQHVTSTDHTIEEPVIAPPTLSTKSPTVEKTSVTRPSSQGDEMNGPSFAQNSTQKRSIDDPKLDPILEQPRLAHVQDEAFDEHTTESVPIPTGPHHAILAPALNLMPAISESMHNKEYDSSLLSERDNRSTFSIREEDDETDGQDFEAVATSMISPAKHSKSPPVSSSSASSAPKKSSMILHPGTLSPAWSLNSIPRDISATYKLLFPTLEPGLDEKLFGLVDRYGFLVEDGRKPTAEKNSQISSSSRVSIPTAESLIHTKLAEKEQERSLKWAKMAKRYTSDANETEYSFTHPKLVSRVFKGIPDCWRAAAWSYLITSKSSGFDPTIRQQFQDLCDTSSPEEEQIDLDIPRTMHGHIMFKERYGPGQCALFNVLKAYSNYNRQVGYCQGMASVVATMLTFFDQEKTFVLLVQLFERYNIHSLVIPGFPALFEAFYIQEGLTKKYAPKVFKALETMGIATPSYASRWYITLYSAGVVPYRTLLRIWDIFLLEGFEWLYFMALALLKYHEDALILNNFEQTMEMLNAKMNIQDDDQLIKIAQKFHKRARRSGIVAQLKQDYIASSKST